MKLSVCVRVRVMECVQCVLGLGSVFTVCEGVNTCVMEVKDFFPLQCQRSKVKLVFQFCLPEIVIKLQ